MFCVFEILTTHHFTTIPPQYPTTYQQINVGEDDSCEPRVSGFLKICNNFKGLRADVY